MRVQSEIERKRGIRLSPPQRPAVRSSYLYRLLTEDVNREGISREVGKYYPGYSLIPSQGYWEGAPESSLIIEISIPHEDGGRVRALAQRIRELNQQQAVLIQQFEIDQSLITG